LAKLAKKVPKAAPKEVVSPEVLVEIEAALQEGERRFPGIFRRWNEAIERYGLSMVRAFQGDHTQEELEAATTLARAEFSVTDRQKVDEMYLQLVPAEERLLPDETPATLAERLTKDQAEPYKAAAHHHHLAKAYMEAMEASPGYLLVSMPPQHGKTELVCWTILWAWTKNPKLRIMYGSYNADRAEDISKKLRRMVNQYGPDLGLQIDPNNRGVKSWSLISGGVAYFIGLQGGATGYTVDLSIIDDPFKGHEDAESQKVRDTVYDTYNSAFLTRKTDNYTAIIIQTRWNKDDLCGRLEAEAKAGVGRSYKVVNIPAEAEENDPLGRKPGEWLWPSKFSDAHYLEFKFGAASTRWIWNSLYQGHPTLQEGNIVKKVDFRFYTAKECPTEFDRIIQSMDPTFTAKAKSDFVALQVWGQKGPNFYCLDGLKQRLEFGQAETAILVNKMKYKTMVATLIENSASGPALEQVLRKRIPGVILIGTKGKDKRTRLLAVEPLVRAHNVYFPANEDGISPPWAVSIIDEVCDYDEGAAHDDQVDAFTQALKFLMPAGWKAEEAEPLGPDFQMGVKQVQQERIRTWMSKVLKADTKRRNPRRFRGRTF